MERRRRWASEVVTYDVEVQLSRATYVAVMR